ncbi:MAG: adenylate/guanylate cyclase domain-containing protein [Candidatus Tectomicrobia bacterium]|nr:adenylate/guanylate cyclase domain-containing protein [Candidatus Tectomicrobia bacterium]
MNQRYNTIPIPSDEDGACISVSEAANREDDLNPMPHRVLPMHPRSAAQSQPSAEADGRRQTDEYYAKFVPETVQHLVAANPEAPELSMRECDVSVLFIDISGYSTLSEKMSPAALNALVERYFSAFLDCIYKAGGDINEIAGDGLMAIFQGTPPMQHAVGATAAALAILAATQALNAENHEQPLTVHMGLNSGTALVGLTRLQGQYGTRWTFTARGPMTNLAARLADGAQPGQILVGPETVRRLSKRYLFQRLGYERFKNMAEPIDIYCLLGPSGLDSR